MIPYDEPVPMASYVATELAVATVPNILNSLSLLSRHHLRALDGWESAASQALTETQRRTNDLLFGALAPAFLVDDDAADFESYLVVLEQESGVTMRDHILYVVASPGYVAGSAAELPRAEPNLLLDDPAAYLARVEARFPSTPGATVLHREAHALLQNPAALHATIVGHLRSMWETQLGPEWERQRGALHNQVNVIERRSATNPRLLDDLRMLLAPELQPDIAVQMAGMRRIVLAPSAHTGPYVTALPVGATLYLFFTAPRSMAAGLRSVRVGPEELLLRLGALADPTRLQILQLFAEQDQLTAQEIMAQLSLTQSTVSRQLRALAPYLQESRGTGAGKRYTFNPTQVNLTFRALKEALAGMPTEEDAPDEREGQPGDLRRFMNRKGLVASFPARLGDKELVLKYLAERFEPGREYSEKQVNDLLMRYIAFDDYVTVRRYLCDYGLLDRTRDGARYWRPATAAAE